jgi:glycerol uptake facilitator-like aquaporin
MPKSSPTKAKAKSAKASASAVPAVKVRTTTVSARTPRRDYRAILTNRLGNRDIMLGALFAELVGTFILTAVVLNTSGNIIIAALSVMVLTIALGKLSGGHVNPAVTVALWASRQISGMRATGYIVAQLLGAMLAVVVVTQFVHTAPVSALTGETPQIFSVEAVTGQWRPFLAEGLGALVFGFGIAAIRFGRREGIDAGFTAGGALLLGLILASQATSALLNPAVALGVSAYHLDNWWTIWVYALAPVFGASVGAWLYKLMQWDLEKKVSNG